MSKIKRIVLAFALFAMAAQASALECPGKVSRVLMYSNGFVMIVGPWRGDYTTICSTNGTFGSIAAEVCLAWYGALVKARADNSNVEVYYPNSTYTCSNLPTYGASPVPGYVMVMP